MDKSKMREEQKANVTKLSKQVGGWFYLCSGRCRCVYRMAVLVVAWLSQARRIVGWMRMTPPMAVIGIKNMSVTVFYQPPKECRDIQFIIGLFGFLWLNNHQCWQCLINNDNEMFIVRQFEFCFNGTQLGLMLHFFYIKNNWLCCCHVFFFYCSGNFWTSIISSIYVWYV